MLVKTDNINVQTNVLSNAATDVNTIASLAREPIAA